MPATHSRPPHLLLAGGGTGGHVFPALAVGDLLRDRGWRVSFAGRVNSLEARLAAQAQLPLLPVTAQPVVGRGPLQRVAALAGLATASMAARRQIRRRRVDVVLGTGGYVSAPTVLGARLAAKPGLLLEPNATVGAANRFLSRFAQGAAIAYPESGAQFRCRSRQTGVPVRAAFHRVPAELPPDPPRLLVLGGSQGARQLNELLPAALEILAARFSGLAVVHQTGAADLETTRAAYAERDLIGLTVETVPFIDDVASALASAHLVVSRAGAVTLAEICAAGRPSLLVPLSLAGAHQRGNAVALEAAGAAAVTPETPSNGKELEAMELAGLLESLLGNRQRLRRMAASARSLARPQAAADIADQLAALRGAD